MAKGARNNYLITKDFDLTVAPMVDLRVPRIFERVNLQMQRQPLEDGKQEQEEC